MTIEQWQMNHSKSNEKREPSVSGGGSKNGRSVLIVDEQEELKP